MRHTCMMTELTLRLAAPAELSTCFPITPAPLLNFCPALPASVLACAACEPYALNSTLGGRVIYCHNFDTRVQRVFSPDSEEILSSGGDPLVAA